jgi:hypothetical protein
VPTAHLCERTSLRGRLPPRGPHQRATRRPPRRSSAVARRAAAGGGRTGAQNRSRGAEGVGIPAQVDEASQGVAATAAGVAVWPAARRVQQPFPIPTPRAAGKQRAHLLRAVCARSWLQFPRPWAGRLARALSTDAPAPQLASGAATENPLNNTKREIILLLMERGGRPLSIAQLPDGVLPLAPQARSQGALPARGRQSASIHRGAGLVARVIASPRADLYALLPQCSPALLRRARARDSRTPRVP